jgi:phosphomevalonate kinase
MRIQHALSAVAPGKALLCGEYAVLHGAPAISVAVDRVARARFGVGQASPFVKAAVAHVERALGRSFGPIAVDSSALYAGEHKLGLGSSAAVTVATVGLCLRAADQPLEPRRAFELADAAHAEAQGARGSGIDVATSVWGGAIRFRRPTQISGRVEVEPVQLPDGLRLTFIYTGRSASTANFLSRIRAIAEANPAHHDAAMATLAEKARAFADALLDARALVEVADAYGRAMGELGAIAGCEIVTPEHAKIAELARAHGGAAKPSGAGGGDLAVALTVGDEATRALADALHALGLAPLSLTAPATGLHLENA